MDTKECIEFLKLTKYPKRGLDMVIIEEREYNEKVDEVIKRLQMWDAFKEKYKGCYLMVSQSARGLNHLMDKFEQEYFPKPKIRKEVRVEVLAENENVIDELAKDIEDMNGRIFNKGKIRVITTRWEKD